MMNLTKYGVISFSYSLLYADIRLSPVISLRLGSVGDALGRETQ